MRASRTLWLLPLVMALAGQWAAIFAQQSNPGATGEADRFWSEAYEDLRAGGAQRVQESPLRRVQPRTSGQASSNFPAPGTLIKQSASVSQEFIPWSSVSWSYLQADLAFHDFQGGLSPLEKYDSIVASLYGRIPGAAAWEADPANTHNAVAAKYKVDWGGHCNGWAAASILLPEPRLPFEVPLGDRPVLLKLDVPSAAQAQPYMFGDRKSDYRKLPRPGRTIILTVADMKGLLAETYKTSRTQQFQSRKLTGTRYDGQGNDVTDPAFRDIEPHYFHWLLQEFVKKNGMAVVMDINANSVVNNHPLYKFESNAVYKPNERKYSVTTNCWLADYAKSPGAVGTNTMVRVFTYDLFLDGSGRVTRGAWTGKSVTNHPDFVWIPVGDMPPAGTVENPAVHGDFVRYLYETHGRRQ